MTKESFKKFVKDHKTQIISGTLMAIGTAALTVVGIKISKCPRAKSDSILNDDKLFIDLLETIDDASAGCNNYVMITTSEIASAIEKGVINGNVLRDPDGKLLEIKNLIAFGNKLEP